MPPLDRFARAHICQGDLEDLRTALTEKERRIAELESRINTPTTDDWFDGVRIEAAHQIERWGVEHDGGKTPWDWFWLVGYLAQKAATAAVICDSTKAKHHTISTAAAMLNWYRSLAGENTEMRPGIAPPEAQS